MYIALLFPCRNMTDVSRDAPDATTAPNPAYGLMKQRDGKSSSDYQYAQVNVSARTGLITKTEEKAYEIIPALPPSHQSHPAIRNVEDVGVAREVKTVVVYDNIRGDR